MSTITTYDDLFRAPVWMCHRANGDPALGTDFEIGIPDESKHSFFLPRLCDSILHRSPDCAACDERDISDRISSNPCTEKPRGMSSSITSRYSASLQTISTKAPSL